MRLWIRYTMALSRREKILFQSSRINRQPQTTYCKKLSVAVLKPIVQDCFARPVAALKQVCLALHCVSAMDVVRFSDDSTCLFSMRAFFAFGLSSILWKLLPLCSHVVRINYYNHYYQIIQSSEARGPGRGRAPEIWVISAPKFAILSTLFQTFL